MTATVAAPAARPADRHRGGSLVGTRHLVRLALRLDRIVLPLWVLVIGVMPAAGAGAYETLYPSPLEREALTGAMSANPSFTLLYGPAFDLSTVGGWTAWRYGVFMGVFLGLACIFTMTRHTRQEEDTGRQELLSSTVLGRRAALTASLLVCLLGSLVAGLLVAGSLIGVDAPVGGSLAFGGGMTLTGWIFTGVAAVAAQFAEYARTANGIACGVLGGAFMLRAIGDALPDAEFLSWLSPIGWSTRVRPYAGEQWWVLLLMLGTAAVLVA
ncbi:MAG: ABC transporter permease, partial [Thermocrispum sp.]